MFFPRFCISSDKKFQSKKQRGGVLLEALLMLGIMAAVTPMIYQQNSKRHQNIEDVSVAQQMRELQTAVKLYAQTTEASNFPCTYGTGCPTPTPDGYDTIDLSSLVNAGFLSTGFSESNRFGQAYEVRYRKSQTDELPEIMIVANATSPAAVLTPMRVRSVAQATGAYGGYYDADSDELKSAFGTWNTDVSSGSWGTFNDKAFAMRINLADNQISGGGGSGDYLPLAGGTMEGGINMDGNTIMGLPSLDIWGGINTYGNYIHAGYGEFTSLAVVDGNGSPKLTVDGGGSLSTQGNISISHPAELILYSSGNSTVGINSYGINMTNGGDTNISLGSSGNIFGKTLGIGDFFQVDSNGLNMQGFIGATGNILSNGEISGEDVFGQNSIQSMGTIKAESYVEIGGSQNARLYFITNPFNALQLTLGSNTDLPFMASKFVDRNNIGPSGAKYFLDPSADGASGTPFSNITDMILEELVINNSDDGGLQEECLQYDQSSGSCNLWVDETTTLKEIIFGIAESLRTPVSCSGTAVPVLSQTTVLGKVVPAWTCITPAP